jgi:3-dehydroquinate synthase
VVEGLTVGLGDRSYEIRFGAGTLAELGATCSALRLGRQVAVVTNPLVGGLYFETVRDSLESAGFCVRRIDIPDGETHKNLETLKHIYDCLIDYGIDRGSFIVALGGGIVGDVAGFAAASYLRGIPFVQVPTTLLAQVDSSVGGKTGVNHEKGKNLIGAFYQPALVSIDVETLRTLDEREYVCGLAEVVKYGVVLDKELFAFLEGHTAELLNRETRHLLHVIRRCCQLKASVVEQDEREAGLRAVLNYGHTLGHAVESLTGYSRFKHGEAVAIGMVQAARISAQLGHGGSEDTERVNALLKALSLPVDLPDFSIADYTEALLHDKKVRDGGINFVFNRGIGDFELARVTDIPNLLRICGIGG